MYQTSAYIVEDENNSIDEDLIKNEDVFMLNFLISYCVYLNELNLMRNSKDPFGTNMKIIKVSKLIPNIDKYLDLKETQGGEGSSKFEFAKRRKNNTNYYIYEVMLLEAIVDYKSKKSILETKIIKNNNNYFLFYTDLMDLFLIDKIFWQVELNENIKKLC